MSNNQNKPNQVQQTTPATQKGPEIEQVTGPDPIKDAVALCLELLLRTAVYGSVPRQDEVRIKDALEKLK